MRNLGLKYYLFKVYSFNPLKAATESLLINDILPVENISTLQYHV